MLENLRKIFPGGDRPAQEKSVSVEQLREILDTIEVKFSQMKQEYAAYRESTEVQIQKAVELERAQARLQSENQKLMDQAGGLENRLQRADRERLDLQEELESLRGASQHWQAEKTALVRQLHEKEERANNLHEQLKARSEEQQQLQELQAAREYWETRLRDLEKQLADRQEEHRQAVARLEAELTRLQAELETRPSPELAGQVAQLQAERDRLADRVEQLNREGTELSKRWQLEHAERQVLEEQLHLREGKLGELQQQFQAVQEEKDGLQKQLQAVQEEKERAVALPPVQVLPKPGVAPAALPDAGRRTPDAVTAPSPDRRQLLRHMLGR